MTSKERVIATIEHREPDRVPIGEWGIDHDHVEKIIGRPTYWRNRKETTLALWENRRDEVVTSLKEDCIALVDALEYDLVTVELVPSKHHIVEDPPEKIKEGVWQDSAGTEYRYAPSNDSIMSFPQHTCKDTLTPEDIQAAMERVEAMDDSVFELIDHVADHYGEKKAILCRSIDIYSILMNVFDGDMTHDLILTLSSPEEIQKMYPVALAYNQRIIDHCRKKGVLIQMQGQDFGTNLGCIMSPESIRGLYMPLMKQVNQATVEGGMYPFFHCCGKIWDILEDYVDAGYVGYQSIQESAGMDTAYIKKTYGDRLTLWTGIQCETLVGGTLQQTEEEVLRNLEICMPGGGYIFGSTNSVQYGAKTENYLRALELVKSQGVY